MRGPQAETRDVLVLNGIRKAFGASDVLKGACFRAPAGTITAIIGRNGAGKTTLFRIVAGRVRPESGHVDFGGERILRPRLSQLSRSGLMYSAQESALTPLFSVDQHLAAFTRRYGDAERTDRIVQSMGLAEMRSRATPTLSGGERQRLSLALAMIRQPTCLLSDEPFAGVSPKERIHVAQALTSLRDSGCAVVISGHDVEDIFAVADQIYWMTAGLMYPLGTPAEAREHFQFRREYLGPFR